MNGSCSDLKAEEKQISAVTGSKELARRLRRLGIQTVFVFQGGAIASAIQEVSAEGLRVVPFDHELDAAYAAEGYARATGKPVAVFVTSGPGATNLLSGLCGSWLDGVPVLFITGQVRESDRTDFTWSRQRGFQEVDIVPIVEPFVKFARRVYEPSQIAYAVTRAIASMMDHPRGPALLDVTMNAQMGEAPSLTLEGIDLVSDVMSPSSKAVELLLTTILGAERPLLLFGGGAQWEDPGRIVSALETLGIPCATTYAGINCLPLSHPLAVGCIGPFGHPSANEAFVQATDVLIVGSRLPSRALPPVVPSLRERLRGRRTAVLTTDPGEFVDHVISPQHIVKGSSEAFLAAVETLPASIKQPRVPWVQGRPKEVSASFALADGPSARESMTQVYSPSQLVFALNTSLPEASNVFVDVGQNAVALALGLMRDRGQRLFSSWANSPMGYSLPAAIGAAVSCPESLPVCVIGDGGIRTALSTLPNLRKFSGQLKVIVWDNGGYGTIIDHIDRMLGGVRTAVDQASGLAHFPLYDVLTAAGVGVDLAEGDLVSRMSAFFQARTLDVLIVPVDPAYRMVSLPEIADEAAGSSPHNFLRQEH